jgi:hypothetical protein
MKKNEMGMACSTCGERKVAYRALIVKTEGRRPLGIVKRRWEDNIKKYIQEDGLYSYGSG